MTQEDKELLLKDLSARLPYETMFYSDRYEEECLLSIDLEYNKVNELYSLEEIKPYLRSMSSMTEEEVNEYNQCWEEDRDDIMIIGKHFEEMYKSKKFTLYMHPVVPMYRHILWLLENHFDFMGLISKGLAIEVTEDNNPYK